MLTATKDLTLPATVTGSWPRSRWYDGGLWGRPHDTPLLDVKFLDVVQAIDLVVERVHQEVKKVAVGMVNYRMLQASMPPVVAARVRRAMEVIPAEQLILSTDYGFGRHGFSRTIAFYKATAIAQARNIVLKELGLPERYVPAADPALQVDVLPDREPLANLPTPWT